MGKAKKQKGKIRQQDADIRSINRLANSVLLTDDITSKDCEKLPMPMYDHKNNCWKLMPLKDYLLSTK